MKIRLEFKLRDMWIGVFWKNERMQLSGKEYRNDFNMWICLIPMFPIHIHVVKVRQYKYGRESI